MTAAVPTRDAAVTLSVRETRMIVERILLTTGLPEGAVPAITNCVLYSQATGLGGLSELQRAIPQLTSSRMDAMALTEGRDGAWVLDGGGLHAWIVANDALDLAIAGRRRGGRVALTLCNVDRIDELRVIAGLAERHRARVGVEKSGDRVVISVIADRLSGIDPVMDAALRRGFVVPHTLWRQLYDRSGAALTPDSIESRRHAGPVMVDAQGRVHGRDDDDTDFELLRGGAPPPPGP
jgi:hypothetical protein